MLRSYGYLVALTQSPSFMLRIKKIDTARYLILLVVGGVVIDTDMESFSFSHSCGLGPWNSRGWMISGLVYFETRRQAPKSQHICHLAVNSTFGRNFPVYVKAFELQVSNAYKNINEYE